ncbi:MAG: tRNA (adenosine(37)-N6)-threonylcarbamoyltransferase complex transferase subunit TsaD [Holosporales bacterium]|jgi:N6-L-threonylcarbamoyladenine synthase|nr:tRNA (adenosine(37)-N6)-threonylcarbamoyltransferase complex transferase subunit TsaD [Holosporales bacterium]
MAAGRRKLETRQPLMKILAIETSCDETAAAVVCDAVEPDKRIISNVVNSQAKLHSQYGGVVPENAARMHAETIGAVVNESLRFAEITVDDIDVVAVTAGPGLIGGLLVGTVTAKTIALAKRKPIVAVNHLEGHLLTARLCYTVDCPYLLLLASGGHFMFVEVFAVGHYKVLGETLDDAAGEAFDKVARMLGLAYPGGPEIERCARNGDQTRFSYTMPLLRNPGCDASFSGIKTATKIHIESIPNITDSDKNDIAASFQNIVTSSAVRQLSKAWHLTSSRPARIVLAGGVAANTELREKVARFATQMKLETYFPPIALCSDNAAMIGWCAIERISAGFEYSNPDFKTLPRWPLS